jgi:hypothetical protein
MKIKNEFFCRALSGVASFSLPAVLFFLLSLRLVVADDTGTPATASQESFGYALVGVAQFDGISYASLIDRQTKFHLLLSTAKPEQRLKLISVGGDDSPFGPSAVIESEGVSIRLKVVAYGDIDLPASAVPASFASFNPASILPAPGFDKVAAPAPPPGATLPLVFQATDPKKLKFTAEQQKAVDQLRRNFVQAISAAGQVNPAPQTNFSPASNTASGNSSSSEVPLGNLTASIPEAGSSTATNPTAAIGQGPTSVGNAPQVNTWQNAQQQSNALLRTWLGWQAFDNYEKALER